MLLPLAIQGRDALVLTSIVGGVVLVMAGLFFLMRWLGSLMSAPASASGARASRPPLLNPGAQKASDTSWEPVLLTPEQEEERLTRVLKRVRRIELITRGMVKETLGGAYHSRFKGQGIEFDDFREYQAGDDVRFLDWNVTARMNEPFVRKYIEERELTVLLVVDVSGSGDYGSHEDSKRERAAEVAAVFAFSAVQNQDKVGLVLVSDQIEAYLPPRKGSAHALRALRDILNIRPRSRRTNLTPALDLALQRISHRALIVVVSDFQVQDTAWEHSLKAVATKHDVVAAQISDLREWELPNVGRVCLADPESGEEYVVNTSHPDVRRLYAQRVSERQDALSRMLRKNGVERLDVRTTDDYVPALKAYFRSRRRRKR